MRPVLRSLLVALLALAPLADARAQGLLWERLGESPLPTIVAVPDPEGTVWMSGSNLYRLDLTEGAPGIWVEVSHHLSADQLLFLSPDSILALRFDRIERSVDRGETWTEVYSDDGGTAMLFEVPQGHPYAGTLFAHTRNENPLRSTDRGATWAPPVFSTEIDGNEVQAMIAVPDGPWPPGRLVAGGYYGITVSDDGGASFAPVHPWEFLRYRSYGFAAVAGPLGTPRLLALVVENTQPDLRIWASDDGGTTWAHLSSVPATDAKAMGSLGGSAALLVTSEGNVWRTEDAGESWDISDRVPLTDQEGIRPGFVALGRDGRIYADLRGSNEVEFVWRTVDPVAVARAEAVPQDDGLSLTVRPNPSAANTVTVEVAMSAPVEGRAFVVDALGRTVAEIVSGAAGGTRAVEVDTSGWAAGVYAVVVEAGGERRVEAFTVVR